MRNISRAIRPRLARPMSGFCGIAAAISCAIGVSACVPTSPQIESRPEPVQAVAAATAYPEAALCYPDRALLAPLQTPDCSFRRSELKTMDPDGWARLKIEYERQCYRSAEKNTRERMQMLQAAIRCAG